MRRFESLRRLLIISTAVALWCGCSERLDIGPPPDAGPHTLSDSSRPLGDAGDGGVAPVSGAVRLSREHAVDSPVPTHRASGATSGPVLAYADGRYLAAWIEAGPGHGTSRGTLRAVRLDGRGAQLDAEPLVLATDVWTDAEPSAAGRRGDFVVTWRGLGDSSSYFYQRVDAATGTSTSAPRPSSGHHVASDGVGYAVSTRYGNHMQVDDLLRPGSLGARVRSFDEIGIRVRSPEVITPAGDDRYLVVWQTREIATRPEARPAQPWRLRALAVDFRESGSFSVEPWVDLDEAEVEVFSEASAGTSLEHTPPGVAVAGDVALVVYYRGSQLVGRRVDTRTHTPLDEAPFTIAVVSTDPLWCLCTTPRVVATTDGFWVLPNVAPGRLSEHNGLAYRIAVDGSLTTVPIHREVERSPSAGVALRFDLTSSGSEVLLAWQGAAGIFAARYDASGTLLEDGIEIGLYPNEELAPALAFDGENALVVWDDRRAPAGLRAMLVDTEGAPMLEEVLSIAPLSQDARPRYGVASSGEEYLIAWVDRGWDSLGTDEGPEALRVSVVSTDGTLGATQTVGVLAGRRRDVWSVAWTGSDYLVSWGGSSEPENFVTHVARDGTPLDEITVSPPRRPALALAGTAAFSLHYDLARIVDGARVNPVTFLGARVERGSIAPWSVLNATDRWDVSGEGLVAAQSGERVLLVWQARTLAGAGEPPPATRLRAMLLNAADLAPIGEPFDVASASGAHVGASIAADRRSFLVTWRYQGPLGTELHARRIDTGGQLVDATASETAIVVRENTGLENENDLLVLRNGLESVVSVRPGAFLTAYSRVQGGARRVFTRRIDFPFDPPLLD